MHLCGRHYGERVNVRQELTEREGLTGEVGERRVRGRKCLTEVGGAS